MNPEPRNIIICSDGTDNKFGRHNTNGVKLFQVLDFRNTSQRGFYDPCVDTYNPAGKIRNIIGKAFGTGLQRNKTSDQRIEQVWFPGVHCDVGGYYKERGLSDGALKWMIHKAQATGVIFKENWQEDIAPDPTARKAMHESL